MISNPMSSKIKKYIYIYTNCWLTASLPIKCFAYDIPLFVFARSHLITLDSNIALLTKHTVHPMWAKCCPAPILFGSYLRLAMTILLKTAPGCVAHFGLACGSWVVVSRGTTLRTFLAPMGRTDLQSVSDANTLVSRPGLNTHTCMFAREKIYLHGYIMKSCTSTRFPHRFVLLALMIHGLGGTWTLEQPSTSLIFRHHRFQWMVKRLRATLSYIYIHADICWVPKNFNWIMSWFLYLFDIMHLRFGGNAFGWNALVPLHLKDQPCGVTVTMLVFSGGGNFIEKRVVASRSWWNAIVILLENSVFKETAKTSRKVGLMASI